MDSELSSVIGDISSSPEENIALAKVASFVQVYLGEQVGLGIQSEVHDWTHMREVTLRTVSYIRKEKGSKKEQKIGFLAAMFHDTIRPKPKLKISDIEHEVLSANLADKKLNELHFSAEDTDEVCEAILGHSFGVDVAGNRKVSANANLVINCLMAADKVRQFKLSIIKERAIFVQESIDEPSAKQIIDYWQRRLKKANEFLNTTAGKIMLRHESGLLNEFSKVNKYFEKLKCTLTSQ